MTTKVKIGGPPVIMRLEIPLTGLTVRIRDRSLDTGLNQAAPGHSAWLTLKNVTAGGTLRWYSTAAEMVADGPNYFTLTAPDAPEAQDRWDGPFEGREVHLRSVDATATVELISLSR